MIDLPDVISLPKALVLWVLRALWWLGLEFGVQTVGRSVGWLFCRAITFGHFPAEQLNELEEANPFIAFFTELLGLALIAFAIYLPSRSWPTPWVDKSHHRGGLIAKNIRPVTKPSAALESAPFL